MPSKGKITTAERRHQDYLRRKGLRVASVYEGRLEKARRKELRRVLAMAKDYSDPIALVPLIEGQIDETGYLPKWWNGLVIDAGLPMAKSTARDLRAMKAAGEEDLWLSTLRRYAATRAGQEITVVTGTWKKTLVGLTRQILSENISGETNWGIERVTEELYQRYLATIEKWQCRRIAQTECMIGMAEAANEAAKTIGIHFTKQWCISGLGNTRASHELVDGLIVDEDEPFSLPGGMLMYPHDTSMGASAGEIINCACTCIRRPKQTGGPTSNQTGTEDLDAAMAAGKLTPGEAELLQETRIFEMVQEMADQPLDYDTKRAIALNNLELEQEFHIRKGEPMTEEQADKQKANPHFWEDDIYMENCATTTPAFVLRERGFDITAKGNIAGSLNADASYNAGVFEMWQNPDGTKAAPTFISKWMNDKGYKEMSKERYREFFEANCSQRGTYIVTTRFEGEGRGHAMVFKRMPDGKLFYIETQEYDPIYGVFRDVDEVCDGAVQSPTKWLGVLRVDDKIFDPKWAGLFSTK